MNRGLFIPSGVDVQTGRYQRTSKTPLELSEWIRSEFEPRNPEELEEELLGIPNAAETKLWRGDPPPWVNPKDLASSGWGVIFPEEGAEEERKALRELLAHRKSQTIRFPEARKPGAVYGEYCYKPSESAADWLRRHKIGPGTTDPELMPYYLLIVGGPEKIPFDFQFDLLQQNAVGRLHFDTTNEYERYARGVIEAEQESRLQVRRATFFGVDNTDDDATTYSNRYLVLPLLRRLARHTSQWELESILGEGEATKARLSQVLQGPQMPAVLFASAHGVAPDLEDPDPPGPMGSLVCQDWPGKKRWGKPVIPEFYFSAEDIRDEMDLTGLISIFFACYSLGTPDSDSFAHESSGDAERLTDKPRLSRLPQRLLGKEGGSALAVVGHVDRARGFSFYWPRVGSQTENFQSALWRLFDGHPVGSAMRYLADRYAMITIRLNNELLKEKRGEKINNEMLCRLWTAQVDARSYAVLGDPAVRLNVARHGMLGIDQ